jgi:hypothetical protein
MLEEELFCKTVKVYLQETVRKDVENLKRKSGVKASKDLIPMQINFIKKYLQGYKEVIDKLIICSLIFKDKYVDILQNKYKVDTVKLFYFLDYNSLTLRHWYFYNLEVSIFYKIKRMIY